MPITELDGQGDYKSILSLSPSLATATASQYFTIKHGATRGKGNRFIVNISMDLPADYAVVATPSQPMTTSVGEKTTTGFSLTLSWPDNQPDLAAGSIDIAILSEA